MKNKILLFAALFVIGFGAQATTNHTTNTSISTNYFNDYGDSFTFVERGVTFAVFQNGEFDFYINPRNGVQVGYQGKGIDISFNSGYNYDAYVQYDNYGAIIQVEDIYIDYDYYGRVNRIGNTNIQYKRDRLVRIGGLRVYYDNYGYYSHYSGYINNYNRHYVFHPFHNYFVRPFFEYSVVSYKPYRNHYKPVRYTYNRDHSRNTYYGNNNYNKRSSNNTRQRVATQNIPKRNDDRHLDRNSKRDYNSKGRSNDNRNSNREYNSEKRTNNNVKSSERRNTSGARTNDNSRTFTKRSTTVTKRTPQRTVEQKRTVTERQPVKVQKRTNNDDSKKSRTVQERTKNTKKRESSKTENTRKRRSS